MRPSDVLTLVAAGVMACVAPSLLSAQTLGPTRVIVVPIAMEGAPNMGEEMGRDLAAMLDARGGVVALDWDGLLELADPPEPVDLSTANPGCLTAQIIASHDPAIAEYIVCAQGRMLRTGRVEVHAAIVPWGDPTPLFLEPVVAADRDSAVAALAATVAQRVGGGSL